MPKTPIGTVKGKPASSGTPCRPLSASWMIVRSPIPSTLSSCIKPSRREDPDAAIELCEKSPRLCLQKNRFLMSYSPISIFNQDEKKRLLGSTSPTREFISSEKVHSKTGLHTAQQLLRIDKNDTTAREEVIECLSRQGNLEAVNTERTTLARIYQQLGPGRRSFTPISSCVGEKSLPSKNHLRSR